MKKSSKQNNNLKSFKRTYFKSAFIFLLAFMLVTGSSLVAFATSGGSIDATLNNFVDLLFSLIRVIGGLLTAWGLIQLIMSLNSHDPNQRVSGAFFFVGGLVIFFVKEILNTIGVSF